MDEPTLCYLLGYMQEGELRVDELTLPGEAVRQACQPAAAEAGREAKATV
jgi:hypothetical protein